MTEKIDRFVGDFAFLSNFFPSTISVDGEMFKTVEHAYQALKTLNPEERSIVRESPTAATAKVAGRLVTLRDDWDSTKIDVMRRLLIEKFRNPILRELLLMTGDAELVENNYWNDCFWGVCRGVGENQLGRLLQEIRKEINDEQAS